MFCNADIDSRDKNIITSGFGIDFFNVPTIIITGFRNQNILITDEEILEGRIIEIRNLQNNAVIAQINKRLNFLILYRLCHRCKLKLLLTLKIFDS